MGWCREDLAGHEGSLVGFVEKPGGAGNLDSGLYRELAYPEDSSRLERVAFVSAACECGWRSSRWRPSQPTGWYPYIVDACELDEEKARTLWSAHAELSLGPKP